MNKLPFDLVIFDCDGVLVESEPLACQVYVQIFAEYGYRLDYAETLQKFHGTTLHERVEITSCELGITPPENFIPVFNARLSALTEHELQPVPHIHDLIESLTVPICVASNGTLDEITLRLKVAGLTDCFGKSIFSGMEVPRPKPAPDVYLAAARSFDVDPSLCVVIEDSLLGVTAAVAARMRVYGYATFNSTEALQTAGAIPFTSMLEMKEILGREFSLVP
jgi:HAD superfamily hydrolase (TIGR01509 family)